MLENDLNEMILSVEQQINLIKIKIKHDKKELKKLNNMCKDSEYININRVQEDELKLTKKISEMENRLSEFKKILYRLKVCEGLLNCEKILNNEEE